MGRERLHHAACITQHAGVAAYAALLLAAYGWCIECVQSVVTYRNFELADILTDSCAARVVTVPLHVLVRRLYRVTEDAGKNSVNCRLR